MIRKNIAVIGSGFGGLAVAIRLQAQGHQVTIFEKQDQPGGRAAVFKENGFTFDAGPTVITAPETLEELFSIAGKSMKDYVELLPVTPFYKLFWEDGSVFDYCGDLEKTKSQIRKFSPMDEAGYLEFLKYSKEVYHEGYEKLAAEPFLNWWSMVKVAPQLAKLRADKSVYQIVSQYIKDDRLRQAFSFHSLLVGGNPFSTSSIYTLIHYLERAGGVFFPKGGTGALVQGLVRLFQDLGGVISLGNPVERITTNFGKVTGVVSKLHGPQTFDLVISNGDVVHTYKQLLQHESLAQPTAEKLEKMRHSMSLFLIYFGTKKTYPELAHHNVMFGPRYQALLNDIFFKGQLPNDFSLYLHAPTRSDASLAPEGHEAFYVLSPVSHLGNMDIDWDVEGPKYAEKILNYLEARYLPDLKQNLVVQKIFTPKDFSKNLNAHVGSAFSLEPILTQSAFFRTHNKDDKLKGLYFVGAGTHPGAGVPGVISSAKATAKVVMSDAGF
ncbi:phytoene desaturase [Bdellovibrio reynosensis]|uniref:Phytoene dehydrogenase n=1 Tax=Bdellovibrio reynosensis TaxID=2835041 RepID=A0ABY4C5F1_9BACT|nr:phytoene desaturase [Bdellovibrio reynosensis]UOF00049.1 phytoene desaturase [Bdellovibrio reynosensis]